ncbi:aldehyde dehydrogenase family protein [Novosphingobium sp. PASSN1]|uniref:aldehyde dehydrogenase family protein n=1 Tax=Novosphingobium sp. PASSN1 TaxID=2015561 RepID=UPI0025CE667F|nr:aldehyde dehydrogenase family protein [Novosphingobium sp. PASSN1]
MAGETVQMSRNAIPPAASALREKLRGMLIGGAWRKGGGPLFLHRYAGDTDTITPVELASIADVDVAIASAHSAKAAWRETDPGYRERLLHRLADLIVQHGEDLAILQTLDTGFPISASRQLIPFMEGWTRYYAGFCDKIEGGAFSQFSHGRYFLQREPYGVVAIILTWNMPITSVCMKAMAALAAGNCVVIKSPEMAPFGMMRMGELFVEAGFPAGVVNILPTGPEGGHALVADPRVGKISFTGGAATAEKVMVSAAANITPTILELGGKSACVIFDDADLDRAIPFAASFPFAATGQACILPTRMLVQDSIYDAVVERVTRIVETFKPGDPFAEATQFGPLIGKSAVDRITRIVEQVNQTSSGRIVLGGHPITGEFAAGAYFEATLVVDVDPASSLFCEEAFGPVLALSRFTDEDEAITLANATRFGLYSYIWTRDIARAMRIADAMEAGSAAINGFAGLVPQVPFGGVGISGYGKEGGREGLNEFLRTKTIFIGN